MPMIIDGNGSISGLSAGGLPAATVIPATLSQPMTLGTTQATTSGTSIDFNGIPSWAKRITVMFAGVSTNGTSTWLVQIGPSGAVETSGYLGTSQRLAGTGSAETLDTTGFGISNVLASSVVHGVMTLVNLTGNTWVSSSTFGRSDLAFTLFGGGSKSLAGTLSRLRLTTFGGTDTFDAGSVNILYEG